MCDKFHPVLAAGQTLGGRYRIFGPIGAGGMGEVYRARDQRLQRDVAVKILPDRVASDRNAFSRFQREARALAALSHPNILAIHDFGEDQGVFYSVTELLHGETLREHLKQKSPLFWKDAGHIGVSVAEGLSAAHGAGIIHRDLKPENIFLTSDHRIKILDFGLARRELNAGDKNASAAPTASGQTAPNVVMGTVPYMSPEQIKGETVDTRTDIFSFGSLFYEMIAGHRPFHGETSPEIMTAILKQNPPTLSKIPPELQQILSHCLEKNREDRFQSVRDLEFALKTILSTSGAAIVPPVTRSRFLLRTAMATLAIVLLAIVAWFWKSTAARPSPGKSIAVLPFSNLSGDQEEEYFSDGMTEDVITQLSKISDLKVISRTSVMPYKNTNKSLREIAKELGVVVILEGSVRRSGNRLRIVSQLIDASTDEHIWADTYDRDLKDVFEVQSDVARHIADALKSQLLPAEKERIEKIPTNNLAAYDVYLKGREHYNRFTKSDSDIAIQLYKKAIELDPQFALAYAGLADAYSSSITYGVSNSILDTSVEMANKAIQLNPGLAEGYEALGYAFVFKNLYRSAIEAEKKALELNPNYARAAGVLGKTLWMMGRLDESLYWVTKYQQLDPASQLAARYVGDVNRMLGNIAEAKKWYEYGLTLDPNARECYLQLIFTADLYGTGEYEEVKPLIKQIPDSALEEVQTHYNLRTVELDFGHYEEAEKYSRKLPDDWKDACDGYLLWRQGKTTEAERLFSRLEKEHEEYTGEGNDSLFAGIYAIRGDKANAYRYLQEAIDRGFVEYRILERTPIYESLRNDPEFQQIIANLKGRIEEMRKRAAETRMY